MAGSLMMVVQNNGSAELMKGDVVAFSGISDGKQTEGLPVVQVNRSNINNRSGAAGVVYGRFHEALLNAPPEGLSEAEMANLDLDVPIQPGDYLLLVVYGPAQVNVIPDSLTIQPGDLLVVGETPWQSDEFKSRLIEAQTGSVIGKALESSTSEDGLIYVFVTLH